MNDLDSIWNDDTPVLLTSFWGWGPGAWAALGFTNEARRDNVLGQLGPGFIGLIYVAESSPGSVDRALLGRLVGFYVVSGNKGHRNEFTDSRRHELEPDKWQYSLQATRAFSFLEEHRPMAKDIFPIIRTNAQSIAGSGRVIDDAETIKRIRDIPCEEVEVYQGTSAAPSAAVQSTVGYARPGPISSRDYFVRGGVKLPRAIYMLELVGDVSSYLGRSVSNAKIIKIGFSHSPRSRLSHFNRAMPRGAFNWALLHGSDFMAAETALRCETAMKQFLCGGHLGVEHLGGEFYLVPNDLIDDVWAMGCSGMAE